MKENWNKKIVLFLASQTISLFGSMLVQYAIMWHITLKTQSGIMMTISIICGFLPTFFLSPFAGVWADRYNRKALIILSDALIAVSTLILAIFYFAGIGTMWMLFVISAVRAIGSGIQIPAVGAFIPQMVPEDKLTKVNGINGGIQSAINILSPVVSGGLLKSTTIETIFLIDVVTAAIAISILLLFLHVPVHNKAAQSQTSGYISDMRTGFEYIRNHGYIKRFFLFCAVFFFLVTPAAFLTPLQVTRTFGEDVWRLTAIEIAFSLGMMVGGIVIASWGGLKNKVHTMALSSIVSSLCTIAFGVIPVFWIYLLVMGIVGLAMPAFNTPSTVLLQEKVEGDFQGRVFGVLGAISSSMMPLGMLLFGPLSDMMRIEYLLVATGILLLVLSFSLLGSKVLVEAGKPVPKS